MIRFPPMKFRTFIIVIFIATIFVTLFVTGTSLFIVRSRSVNAATQSRVRIIADDLAYRAESMLSGIEQTITPLCRASTLLDGDSFGAMLDGSMDSQPMIRAVYFIDAGGKTFAVGARDNRNSRHDDFTGIDFSNNPLYNNLLLTNSALWSDKFMSTLTGDTCIAVGIRIATHTAIAELSLDSLLEVVSAAAGGDARVLVVDRRGELVVDTEREIAAGALNIRDNPDFAKVADSGKLPGIIALKGKKYHPAAAYSEKLGWYFLAGVRAGLANPYIYNTMIDIILFSFSFLIAALLISPFWTGRLNRQVARLHVQANRMSEANEIPDDDAGFIQEFNSLSVNMQVVARRILEREEQLKALNLELEDRVSKRTAELTESNLELSESLDANIRMRDMVVRSEKLAALGRLVAGVAHEMNTPIGNAVMAVSSLQEETKSLAAGMKDGLRKSVLEAYLESSTQGLGIAERNLQRTAELVISFKHVASDQTSSTRRKFGLEETLKEILLTLHPTLKRSPHRLMTDIETNVELDSYPGVLGQIVANLVTNAITHAWGEGESGTVTVRARTRDPEKDSLRATGRKNEPAGRWVRISVSDDGRGIPPEIGRKIFEPFFTTMMGRGGTGLGLNIAYNGARNILGGSLDYASEIGKGSTFVLDIPLIAPFLNGEEYSVEIQAPAR